MTAAMVAGSYDDGPWAARACVAREARARGGTRNRNPRKTRIGISYHARGSRGNTGCLEFGRFFPIANRGSERPTSGAETRKRPMKTCHRESGSVPKRQQFHDRRASPEIDRASRSTAPVSRNHPGRSETPTPVDPVKHIKALFSDHGKRPTPFEAARMASCEQRKENTRRARRCFRAKWFSSHILSPVGLYTRARRAGRAHAPGVPLSREPPGRAAPRLASPLSLTPNSSAARRRVPRRDTTLHPRIRRLTGRRRGRSPRRRRRGRPPRACRRT